MCKSSPSLVGWTSFAGEIWMGLLGVWPCWVLNSPGAWAAGRSDELLDVRVRELLAALLGARAMYSPGCSEEGAAACSPGCARAKHDWAWPASCWSFQKRELLAALLGMLEWSTTGRDLLDIGAFLLGRVRGRKPAGCWSFLASKQEGWMCLMQKTNKAENRVPCSCKR